MTQANGSAVDKQNHDGSSLDPALAPPLAGRDLPSSGVPDKLILTVEEAAACLGISRAFAYELANRREIPAIRLGRRILVPREQLLRFVADSTSAPPVKAKA